MEEIPSSLYILHYNKIHLRPAHRDAVLTMRSGLYLSASDSAIPKQDNRSEEYAVFLDNFVGVKEIAICLQRFHLETSRLNQT